MLASRRRRTQLPLWTSASPSLPENTRCLGLLIRRHLGHEHERNCSQVCAKVAGETAQMPHLPATARLMGTGLWPFGERTPLPHQRPSPPDPPEGGPWRAPSLEGRGPLTLLPPWRAAAEWATDTRAVQCRSSSRPGLPGHALACVPCTACEVCGGSVGEGGASEALRASVGLGGAPRKQVVPAPLPTPLRRSGAGSSGQPRGRGVGGALHPGPALTPSCRSSPGCQLLSSAWLAWGPPVDV